MTKTELKQNWIAVREITSFGRSAGDVPEWRTNIDVKVETLNNPTLEAETLMAAMVAATPEAYRTNCDSYPIKFNRLVGFGFTNQNYLGGNLVDDLETIEIPTFVKYVRTSVTISIDGIGTYEDFSSSQEMGIRNNGVR